MLRWVMLKVEAKYGGVNWGKNVESKRELDWVQASVNE
jgi:hypothetical protein